MNTLIEQSKAAFQKHFSSSPSFLFQAPGRVNLIGEHTDHNNGFVLPCTIDRGTVLAISPRQDNVTHVYAESLNAEASDWKLELPISHIPSQETQGWSNYLRGVCEQFLQRDLIPKGMNIVAVGNIPQGAGLSSSASFSVALATAINEINTFGLNPSEIALLCQAAENDFVGCKCGIMDQLISAAGQQHKALLIDCADLSYKTVTLPDDAEIIIINSKVTRGLVDSEYNTRRAQCKEAAKVMGIPTLREANMEILEATKTKMNDVIYRRARHVITENKRTIASAEALQQGDYVSLSRYMAESHNSMRDDFEITVPQIDFIVSQVASVIGSQGGVRMTGGGFGGCVVAIAPPALRDAIVNKIHLTYPEETGLNAEIYFCKTSSGANRIQ